MKTSMKKIAIGQKMMVLAVLVTNTATFAKDTNELVYEKISRLGYCYQFPVVYEQQFPDPDSFSKEDLQHLEDHYISLVLAAPEESEAYRTRRALEDGKNRFLENMTYLTESALRKDHIECVEFLGKYIKRVSEIEKNSQQPLHSD